MNDYWANELSKLFEKGSNDKQLHSKTISVYRAKFRHYDLTDNHYSKVHKCYVRFSNALNSEDEMKGILGCAVVVINEKAEPIFAMTSISIEEFPLSTPRMVYEFFKAIVNKSVVGVTLSFLKRLKIVSLINMIRANNKVHKTEFIDYYSCLKYIDEYGIISKYRFKWHENIDGKKLCTIYKNNSPVGSISNLEELNGNNYDEVNTWTFFPKKGTPRPYDIIGKIRFKLYEIMWILRGSPKYRII